MRTRIYVDGFNLYYRALKDKGQGLKWLNLELLFDMMLPNNAIGLVRYFTARVRPLPDNPDVALRQQVYLRALQTLPKVSIHYGFFMRKKTWRPLVHPHPDLSPMAQVMNSEEKGSDVNLATHLLADGYEDLYDVAIVVSNDSDLREPLDVVANRLNKRIGLLTPVVPPTKHLRDAATFWRPILRRHLAAAQFPDALTDGNGKIHKPAGW